MGNTNNQSTKTQRITLRIPGWAYDQLEQHAKREAMRTGHPITVGSFGRKLVIDFVKGLSRSKS